MWSESEAYLFSSAALDKQNHGHRQVRTKAGKHSCIHNASKLVKRDEDCSPVDVTSISIFASRFPQASPNDTHRGWVVLCGDRGGGGGGGGGGEAPLSGFTLGRLCMVSSAILPVSPFYSH